MVPGITIDCLMRKGLVENADGWGEYRLTRKGWERGARMAKRMGRGTAAKA